MATRHIENSLGDILKDPSFQFGELASGLGGATTPAQLLEEIKILQTRRAYEKDGSGAQKGIDAQISGRQAELSKLSSTTPSQQPPRYKSLFDDKAVIDYARYVTSAQWEDNLRRREPNGNFTKPYEFIVNNPNPTNRIVTGDTSLNSDYNDGLSILNLIRWSEQYPALQLRYQDFVYCKHLNVYPNNRLVILRKFQNGVPDNLFDYFHNDSYSDYAQPISTLVSWMNPKDTFLRVDFKEVWTSKQGSFFENTKEKKTDDDSFFNFSLYNLGDNALFFKLLDYLDDNQGDVTTSSDSIGLATQEPSGNPNLIRNAAVRKTGGEGIYSKISFSLDFEYEWRMIDNVDPTIAMLDMIGNCFRMGTDVAAFRMDFSLLKNNAVLKILNGQFEIGFTNFFRQFGEVQKTITTSILEGMANVVKTVSAAVANPNGTLKNMYDAAGRFIGSDGGLENGVNATAKYIISHYRESIKNSLYSETGLPGGIWHVTIGNPKNPVVSCGDLIIGSSTLELGKELGLNDFPTSFKYSIELDSARERGRNELERIMNAGRGRVYVYPHAWDNSDNHLTDETAVKK